MTGPDAWRLRLLGEPVLERAAVARPLAAERSHQLLAFLAHQGDWVGRERLAQLFWPEHGAEAARRNLRKVLHRLRAQPELPPLEDQHGALRWAVPTDIRDFERLADAGDTDGALQQWRGEPWQGLDGGAGAGFAQWIAFERQRLRTRWRGLLLQRAEAEDATTGATAARALLAHDGLDEDALALLLRQELRRGHRAAAVQAFEDFRRAMADALGLAPAPALRALLDEVGPSNAPPLAVAAVAHPATPAPGPVDFIGRQLELKQLQALLAAPPERGARWVTLAGPGGIGKTTLARAAAARRAADPQAAVLEVALDDLTDPSHALARVAQRLGQHLGLAIAGHESPWPRLVLALQDAALQDRALLLVLDNLEQLRPAAHALAAQLADCPGVRVLATSRERLGLPDEQVLVLGGLPWPAPEDADQAEGFDAVRLFTARATRADRGFRAAAEGPAIAALCALVEGHPLALELAAAWTRLLSVSEIVAEIAAVGAGTAALSSPAADQAPARHASIATTLQQSWERLVDAERRLLAALSVFRGGFTLDAARFVAGASLPLISALVDKSLLRREADEAQRPTRFSLHPLVQPFAAARLAADDAQRGRRAHAQAYLGLLARFPRGRWAEQPAWYAALDPDAENVRAAWLHAVAEGDAALLAPATIGLVSYLHARSRWDDGLQLLDAAAPALARDPGALAQLQCSTALIESNRGNAARTAELARSALRTARRRGDERLARATLFFLGQALVDMGHLAAASRCYQDALQQARAQGDGHGQAMNLHTLSALATQAGRLDEAVALAEQSLAEQQRLGILHADTLADLAHAQRLAGQPAAAVHSFARAQAALDTRRPGTEHTQVAYLQALAALDEGRLAEAARFTAQAEAGLALGGQPVYAIGIALLQARLALARGTRSDAADAEAALRQAAADARSRQQPAWSLAVAAVQAERLARQGRDEDAAALWRLVAQHPATAFVDRRRAPAAATLAHATAPLALDDALRSLIDG